MNLALFCVWHERLWAQWNRSFDMHISHLVAQTVKHLPAMWETQVQFLGQEDPLEKEMAIHSSTLAWKIPWMEPDRLQSMGSQSVGHNWATSLSLSFHFQTQWCHPAISSSVAPFSCPQSLPAWESFPMSQLFTWGGQSTGVSALASFLPKKSQGWSSSEWTGWISL